MAQTLTSLFGVGMIELHRPRADTTCGEAINGGRESMSDDAQQHSRWQDFWEKTFDAPALLAPQPGEAHGRAQFPELGALLLGSSQSLAIQFLGGIGIPLPQQ